MTTFVPPELVRSTGTLTVEDIDLAAQTGNEGTLDFTTDLAAAGDIHNLILSGEDSLGNSTAYASMVAEIIDATDGSEDGALRFESMQGGANTEIMTLAEGLTMNGATGGDQGVGTINATQVYVNGVALSATVGDVVGPAGATDHAVARYDTATGKLLQDSGVLIDDSDNITGVNDLTVGGNLTVSGTTSQLDTVNLAVEDSLIQLARANNTTDALDIGFVGLYDTSGSQDLYAGLFRDATDNTFKLFDGSQEDLSSSNVVNTGAAGYTIGTLVANLTGTASGNVANTLFDANTILAANADDTPLALTVPEQTLVGRITAGNIDALTVGEAQTLLNVEDGSEANRVKNTGILTDPADFTAGTSNGITLPAASPSDNEDLVKVFFNGIKQHASEWSIVGTALTFTATIPVGVTAIEVEVLT